MSLRDWYDRNKIFFEILNTLAVIVTIIAAFTALYLAYSANNLSMQANKIAYDANQNAKNQTDIMEMQYMPSLTTYWWHPVRYDYLINGTLHSYDEIDVNNRGTRVNNFQADMIFVANATAYYKDGSAKSVYYPIDARYTTNVDTLNNDATFIREDDPITSPPLLNTIYSYYNNTSYGAIRVSIDRYLMLTYTLQNGQSQREFYAFNRVLFTEPIDTGYSGLPSYINYNQGGIVDYTGGHAGTTGTWTGGQEGTWISPELGMNIFSAYYNTPENEKLSATDNQTFSIILKRANEYFESS